MKQPTRRRPLRTSLVAARWHRRAPVVVLLLLVVLTWDASVRAGVGDVVAPAPAATGIAIPRAFLPMAGAGPAPPPYVSPFGPAVLRAEVGGVSMLLSRRDESGIGRQHVLRLAFEGSRAVAPEAEAAGSGVYHLLLGRDPAQWRRHLPAVSRLVYRGLYPGVDLYVGWHGERLEFRADLSPGADPGLLRWRVEGAAAGDMAETPEGGARVQTPAGVLRLDAPVFQTARGRTTARCRIVSDAVLQWDESGEELQDVTSVIWSTFLGGSTGESVKAAMIDESGLVTLVGFTSSIDFPITPGALDDVFDDPHLPKIETFITRIDPVSQQLVFSTFLGGVSADRATRGVTTATHEIVVAGFTNSADFPVTAGAFDTELEAWECFVTKLAADGSAVLFSTLLGGETSAPISLTGLDVSDSGAVAVVGLTGAIDFPTTPGALMESYPGASNNTGFVTVFDPELSSLVLSTYLGGSQKSDWPNDVRFGPGDSVYVVGETSSPDFPLTSGAFQTESLGQRDAFACHLSADGTSLIASTLLSGPGTDVALGLDLMPDGSLAIVGATVAPGFPTTLDAFDPTGGGFVADAFISQLDPSLAKLLYSTYLGSAGIEWAPFAIVAGPSGEITVAGGTSWDDFPVTPGAFQVELNGFSRDAWIARLHPSGRSLLYSTFLGGSQTELSSSSGEPLALAVDGQGNVIIAGNTLSPDFPTTDGAFMDEFTGITKSFVTHLTMVPDGVQKFGTSTPGPQGPLAIGVSSQPRLGSTRFGITCSNAPAGATGALALGLSGLPAPVGLAGAQAWIDPATLVGFLPMSAGRWGWAELLLPIPPDAGLLGLSAFAQTFWSGGSAGLTASNALVLTIVP